MDTLELHQNFQDLIQTLNNVGVNGQTTWDNNTIIVDLDKSRIDALRELMTLVRTASELISKI